MARHQRKRNAEARDQGERAGNASYGRWMLQTLRLVSGRVEVSSDNHSFRVLAEQAGGCAIPPIG